MATSKKNKKKSSGVPSVASGSAKPRPVAVSVVQPVEETPAQAVAELKEEYAYVRKDLRQLGLVSVVLFAVMLGIGLII